MASIVPPPKYGAFNCPACGEANYWPKVRYCTQAHATNDPRVNTTTHADAPAPHLHRTCGRCKRVDMIPTANEGGAR